MLAREPGRGCCDERRERSLAHVVLMGMGEPLHNYDAVARALGAHRTPEGIGLSLRRITCPPAGWSPEIDRLGHDFAGQIGLAVSVHAAENDTRTRLMPINQQHPLDELSAALRRYPLRARRALTIEYTLIDGDERRARRRARPGAHAARVAREGEPDPDESGGGHRAAAPGAAAVDAFQRALTQRRARRVRAPAAR